MVFSSVSPRRRAEAGFIFVFTSYDMIMLNGCSRAVCNTGRETHRWNCCRGPGTSINLVYVAAA